METRMTAADVADTGGKNGAAIGALAAKMLSGENGARVAMIETGGWDTHSAQRGRLSAQLRSLDQMVARVASLTEDEVAAAAATYFDPERQTVVWLGPQEQERGAA